MPRWMQTRTYHVLHTGGFLRLATERGRVYWVAQNMTSHSTPDWVSHLSCLTGYELTDLVLQEQRLPHTSHAAVPLSALL